MPGRRTSPSTVTVTGRGPPIAPAGVGWKSAKRRRAATNALAPGMRRGDIIPDSIPRGVGGHDCPFTERGAFGVSSIG